MNYSMSSIMHTILRMCALQVKHDQAALWQICNLVHLVSKRGLPCFCVKFDDRSEFLGRNFLGSVTGIQCVLGKSEIDSVRKGAGPSCCQGRIWDQKACIQSKVVTPLHSLGDLQPDCSADRP
eukprot:158093-Pelagomonas_calceolata.AAC.1